MSSEQPSYLERFYPVDWDPGTHLVLHVFDSYDTCLRRLRPHVLYLLQLINKNLEIIPGALTRRLKTLVDQFQASIRRKVGNARNLIARRGHRTARELFKQIRSIRMEFDYLATKKVVEVIKHENIANQQPQGDTVPAGPGGEITAPEDASQWDEKEDARILGIKRRSPDEVQAALIWIRDAFAIFRHACSTEQAELLLELHTEWYENASKPAPWYKKYLAPFQRGPASNLRNRVLELKWSIASNEDHFIQLEKERRAHYAQELGVVAEATSTAIRAGSPSASLLDESSSAW